MARSNYQFQKRQKELARKQKKEEKRRKKMEKKSIDAETEPGQEEDDEKGDGV